MVILKERIAVVTGGSRGIGAAIVKALAAVGMKTAILSEKKSSAAFMAKEIVAGGHQCLGIQCDVSDVEQVKNSLAQVADRFGGIDVVVNNAGVLDMNSIEDMTCEFWNRVMAVNLRGAFFMIQQSLPYLKNSSAGRIINISSNSGRMGGYENGIAYTAKML